MNNIMRHLLSLPEQASTFARHVDGLHYIVATTTVVFSILALGAAFLFALKYRARRANQSTPVVVPSFKFELTIIVLPSVIFLAWFLIGFRDYVWMNTPPKDAMDVYVMAKKWMWKFAHPEGPNEVSVLHVPKGRPVRLLMTSRDVIHSFYVPDFRIKMDVLPGRYTQAWFEATKTGRFQVLCAEYCGTLHSGMWAEVEVMEPEAYEEWITMQKRGLQSARDVGDIPSDAVLARGSLIENGRRLANVHGCLKCHSTDGSPHVGPTWVNMWGRKTTLQDGTTLVVDEGYMTESMMDPGAKVVAGFANVMPVYRGKLPAPDAAAIVEYIRSLTDATTNAQPPPAVTLPPTAQGATP